MLSRDVTLFRCPRCRGKLAIQGRSENGALPPESTLRCEKCKTRYPVRAGVPRFVIARDLDERRRQTQKSYSVKWSKSPTFGTDSEATRSFHHDWYKKRYGFDSDASLERFLEGCDLVLDAGTGLGRDTFWYSELGCGRVFGLDISTSVDIASKKVRDPSRVTFVQGDLMSLPFASDTFDFVACDQVLPCIAEPEHAVRELCRVTRPGGRFIFYVYRRRGPIREFANDYLRDRISRMPPERAWEECRAITELGRVLTELHATIELEHDIPLLEIKAGRYDVQRFIFYNFLKCFWNESHTFDENNLVNYDWYHPSFTYRHTEADVKRWLKKLGVAVEHFDHEEPSGISVVCRKPAKPAAKRRRS
jgi:ubiquinone/menaquinone biosynthesis C-methylase UbiE/uncharacterized protein YbaR (Trm112 family)